MTTISIFLNITFISQLAEVGYVSDADKTENAVRSKICDFQEDIAILNALPNVTVGKEWTYSLVDTGNITRKRKLLDFYALGNFDEFCNTKITAYLKG